MSAYVILVTPQSAQSSKAPLKLDPFNNPWILGIGALGVLLLALAIYSQVMITKLAKQKRFEEYKNRELQKKLKLALNTISKMERNPDLIHSREFNLDYLRMRMEEEQFHFSIMNQIKIRVKEKISIALRPVQAEQGLVGIASSTGRHVDEIFDVEYDPSNSPKGTRRVLFRIQIKLMKLPSQPTSVTINQIIDCMQKFMSLDGENHSWQPTIQGRIASVRWDQKAKPTPLLVLEQSNEGVNVTFRTNRMAAS